MAIGLIISICALIIAIAALVVAIVEFVHNGHLHQNTVSHVDLGRRDFNALRLQVEAEMNKKSPLTSTSPTADQPRDDREKLIESEQLLLSHLDSMTVLPGHLRADDFLIDIREQPGSPELPTLVAALRSLASKELVSWNGRSDGSVERTHNT